MIRCCFQTTTEANLIYKADGSYVLEGLAAEQYKPALDFTKLLHKPFNVSFYLTMDAEECITRLERNQSDVTNVLVPIFSQSERYEVSSPTVTARVQLLSGYSITEGEDRQEETATAIANAHLLETEVYEWFLFLLLSFILFIAFSISLHLSLRKKSSLRTVVRLVCKKVIKILFSSSGSFRWIQFLYSLLIFIMITSFLCLYKTSHVIVSTPFYPKNYKESLNDNTSVAFYYDQFYEVSRIFKDASAKSVKGRLWKKLIDSGKRNRFKFNLDSADQAQIPMMFTGLMREMAENKSIVIASSTAMPLVRAALQGLSPESELWVLKVFTDPSESEIHYGGAMRWGDFKKLSAKQYSASKASLLGDQLFKMGAQGAGEIFSSMTGTSNRHKVRQMNILDDENAFLSDVHVKAIPLTYFSSFFAACLVVWAAAFVINFLQCR